jgi:aspartate racemase
MNKKIIKIGIIGGFGPLASASWVETIYSSFLQKENTEQNQYLPYVYLYSEPLLLLSSSVMSLKDSETELLAKLKKNIANLVHQEVDFILICCWTAHALLPKLLHIHQAQISSLVTLVLENVMSQKEQFMIFSASSAREGKVLETHPLWSNTGEQINFVEDHRQKQLDLLIQAVKNNQVNSQILADFFALTQQFPDHQLIIACAELHILHKKLQAEAALPSTSRIFDPFFYMIQKIKNEKR